VCVCVEYERANADHATDMVGDMRAYPHLEY